METKFLVFIVFLLFCILAVANGVIAARGPATMLMVGTGLIAIAGIGRKKLFKT